MMKELPEWVGKELLAEAGIPTPTGVVYDAGQKGEIALPDPPLVVKAQAPVSGRGKKGGIRFCETVSAATEAADSLLDSTFEGHDIENVLIEERVTVDEELYLSVSADGSKERPVFIFSPKGGSDIEEIEESYISRQVIDPLIGVRPYHVYNAFSDVEGDLGHVPISQLQRVAMSLWEIFTEHDLRLMEVNPVGIFDEEVVAMDAKAVIDDSAEFRHDFPERHTTATDVERRAAEEGIELRVGSGEVGIISNGAGMGMATLDLIADESETAFSGFIDTHGTQFDKEQVPRFLQYLKEAGSNAIIVNIIGPFLDCRLIAEGVSKAVDEGFDVPVVARFKGQKAGEAKQMCESSGIATVSETQAAVETSLNRLEGLK